MMMMTLVHLRQEDSGSRAQLTKLCKRKRNLLFLESSFFNYEKESVFTIVLPPQLVGVGGDDAVNDVGSYEDDEDKDDNRNYDNKHCQRHNGRGRQ